MGKFPPFLKFFPLFYPNVFYKFFSNLFQNFSQIIDFSEILSIFSSFSGNNIFLELFSEFFSKINKLSDNFICNNYFS